MENITIFNVADWFLSQDSMTPKKLQKIVYYAYAWVLTLMNESKDDISARLFDDHPEAWVHGPVFSDLYREYKDFGWREIPMKNTPEVDFGEDVEDILRQVWGIYGEYTGNELESITHQESPWIDARKGCGSYDICNNIISDESIYECYSERL